MKNDLKIKAKQQAAFLQDIYDAMERHHIKNVLIVYGMNEQIRNTYLFTGDEEKLYSFLSDGTDAWLRQLQKPNSEVYKEEQK